MNPHPSSPLKSKHAWIAILLAALALQYSLLYVRDARWQHADSGRVGFLTRFITEDQGTSLVSQDFSWHFHFAAGIANGISPRPYTEEGHRLIARDWLHADPPGVFIYGYSPVLTALVYPFHRLPVEIAFGLFALASLGAAAYCLTAFIRINPDDAFTPRFLLFTWISLSACTAVQFGQAVFLLAGAMTFAWCRTRATYQISRPLDIPMAVLFCLLTAKPNYALLFGSWLIITRCWKTLFTGAGLSGALVVVMAPLHGGWPAWITDYTTLLSNYSGDRLPPLLASCLDPKMSSNAAAIVIQQDWMTPALAFRISLFCWLTGLAFLWLAPLYSISRVFLFRANVLLFLLFSPHLFHYEDVLLGVLAAAGWKDLSTMRQRLVLAFAVIAVNGDPVHGVPAFFHWGGPPLSSLAKLALAAVLFWPQRDVSEHGIRN